MRRRGDDVSRSGAGEGGGDWRRGDDDDEAVKCAEGCRCPVGQALAEENKCVDVEQCPCSDPDQGEDTMHPVSYTICCCYYCSSCMLLWQL